MVKCRMPDACLNCEQPFGTPRPRFCPQCGQESNVKPPTLREFAQQFGGSYIAVEGALWRTLKLLLFKPGAATAEYLAGRRRRYVLPLRLYLTISVVVLLVLRATAAVQIDVQDNDRALHKPRSMAIHLGFGEAGLQDNVFFCRGLPDWMCHRIQRRIDVDPKALKAQIAGIGERFVANLGTAMFVLLPSFALWLRLAYRNRHLRYTEHLVFALHVHAFWFLMLALMLTDQALLSGIGFFAVPVYTLLALRRVYGGRWWPRLLRAAVVSTLYGLTLALALTGLALFALLS